MLIFDVAVVETRNSEYSDTKYTDTVNFKALDIDTLEMLMQMLSENQKLQATEVRYERSVD